MSDMDEYKKLLPKADSVGRFIPHFFGGGLAIMFGFGGLVIPLLLLATFFPSAARFVYTIILFVVLGFFFNILGFLIAVGNDWLPWSMASWWTVSHYIIIPTGLLSLYLAGDVNTYHQGTPGR